MLVSLRSHTKLNDPHPYLFSFEGTRVKGGGYILHLPTRTLGKETRWGRKGVGGKPTSLFNSRREMTKTERIYTKQLIIIIRNRQVGEGVVRLAFR